LFILLSHACHIHCPSSPPWFDHPNNIWRRAQIMKLSLCNFLKHPVISSIFCPNILLSTLFSNALSLSFPLNVRDRVSHPYRHNKNIISNLIQYLWNCTCQADDFILIIIIKK
jgi:hypothetical protein